MSNTGIEKGKNGLPVNDLWRIVSGDASDCRAFLKKITSIPRLDNPDVFNSNLKTEYPVSR